MYQEKSGKKKTMYQEKSLHENQSCTRFQRAFSMRVLFFFDRQYASPLIKEKLLKLDYANECSIKPGLFNNIK